MMPILRNEDRVSDRFQQSSHRNTHPPFLLRRKSSEKNMSATIQGIERDLKGDGWVRVVRPKRRCAYG